jgi:hypothetical protein
MTTPFKVSWTILSTWASGRQDEAIKILAGLEMPTTPAMERGSRLHKVVSEGRLPLLPQIGKNAIYEDIRPDEGKWQNYFRVPVTNWLDLSLVIDVLDAENKLVVDWKASTKRSTEHNKMQIYLYALAMSKLPTPIKIEKGIFGTINEFDNAVVCTDYSMFKINDEKIELALNYCVTIAGEIKDYLDNKGVICN